MLSIPELRDTLMEDTLLYAATVMIAFGIGLRLQAWITNDAYVAPLFYTAVLFLVYAKWIYRAHGDA